MAQTMRAMQTTGNKKPRLGGVNFIPYEDQFSIFPIAGYKVVIAFHCASVH
jgi:hypothetical protein